AAACSPCNGKQGRNLYLKFRGLRETRPQHVSVMLPRRVGLMRAILVLATVWMASLASAWAGPSPSVRNATPDASPALAIPDTDTPPQTHSAAMHFLQAPR